MYSQVCGGDHRNEGSQKCGVGADTGGVGGSQKCGVGANNVQPGLWGITETRDQRNGDWCTHWVCGGITEMGISAHTGFVGFAGQHGLDFPL